MGRLLGRLKSPRSCYVLRYGVIGNSSCAGPYIGDLGRMGILGEPDAELRELLEQIDEIRKPADVLFLLRP